MRLKGKLFVLLAVFVAIGLVTASGAFTTVQATRAIHVETTGDATALLALEPADGPNGAYVDMGTHNELSIDLARYGGPHHGVNEHAITNIQNVFNITNFGTQAVWVSIGDKGDTYYDSNIVFYSVDYAPWQTGGLEFDATPNHDGGPGPFANPAPPVGHPVKLMPGETLTVSIYIDTTTVHSNDAVLVKEVIIKATADNPRTENVNEAG